MGKRSVFRPKISEALEGRLLLTGTTEPVAALVDAGASSTSSTAPADAYQLVRTAYNGFIREYYRAVDSVLLVRGANGSIDPVANRASFDREVSDALDALAAAIAESGAINSPGAFGDVQLAINGSEADSLRSRLESLQTPNGDQDATPRMFLHDSLRTIGTSLARTTAQFADAAKS